ncbi:MAG TPA: hypothetical protein VLZ83_11875 [Edaphocola sp.]|nr:hypothetical protein [Edaphocola sp.]
MDKKRGVSWNGFGKRNSLSLGGIFKNFVVSAIAMLILIGCSFPFQLIEGNSSEITDINGSLDFYEISRQGFMGGSILYNPEKSATGQLAKGVSVAIRLGYVECEFINSEQSVYTDIPEKAQFGTLYITDINKNSISFQVKLFDAKGNSNGSSTYYLNINEKIDINSDGLPDLEYKEPARKRVGFESAIYLNFLSSQETLNTAMFAVLPEQYSRGIYPSGIIGINPDGRFILRKYEDIDNTRRSMIYGIQKGDFVLDTIDGKYQRVVSSVVSRNARTISESELEDVENMNLQVSYYFQSDEFGSIYNPDVLLNALPESITSEFMHINSVIDQLNAILLYKDLIRSVNEVQETPIPREIFNDVIAQISILTDEEIVQLNRFFLEETYPAICPQRIEKSICYTEILPLASILFGYSNDETSNYDDTETRAATVSEYESEHTALEKEYKTYTEIFRQSLTAPSIPVSEVNVTAKLSKSYFALGFRGSFSASWGSVSSTIKGVVYIHADANVETNVSFSKNLFNLPLFKYAQPVFTYGPITLNLNAHITVDVPLNVTVPVSATFKMRAAVTGLYGAGFDVGLKYGVTWKKIWFIKYPAPYFDWTGDKWSLNKTVYYVDTDGQNSAVFHGVNASIFPNISAGIGADICQLVGGGISVGTGVKSYLSIKYTEPVLTGVAGLDGNLYLKATAFIKTPKIPIIGSLGNTWTWDIINYNKSIASWKMFETIL